MTAPTMPERMAMFEVEMSGLRTDLNEVKTDVKEIGAKLDNVALNLAVKNAIEEQTKTSRSSTGMWLRFFSERILAILALGASAYAILKG